MNKRNGVFCMKCFALLLSMVLFFGCASRGKKAVFRNWDTYGIRAYRYFLEGDFVKSIQLYKRGYVHARRADDVSKAAQYLFNTGRVFYEMGFNDSAEVYLSRSYEDMLYYRDSVPASRAAALLSVCEAGRGDKEKSSGWFEKTRVLRGEDCPHFYSCVKTKCSFLLSGRIENPETLESALNYYRKEKNHASLSQIYLIQARQAQRKGDCLSSRELLEKALGALDKSPERFRRHEVLVSLSSVLFCSGEDEAGRRFYGRAVDCAPLGVEIPSLEQISTCQHSCR
ncbi:MAG: hypothetical protein ACLFVE_04550 [Chitinispirillaceae bacterium]